MKRFSLAVALLLGLGPSVASAQSAQSAADIVDRMLDAFEANTASVENYSVVQEVMGFESELYFEKEMEDGRPVFHLVSSSTGGFAADLDDDLGYSDIYAAGPELAEHARYGGLESIEGREAHVLVIDDLAALDLTSTATPEDTEFHPRNGRIYVDADLWVPRRMEFAGDLDTGDGLVEVTSVIEMEDYRDDAGILLPYRTVVRMDGLAAALDPEMRAELEELQRQLEELPEEQRAMVEEMFAGRMDQMEALLGGEDGGMTVEMLVLDVRVNEGPPH
ncbi:MAG: hypothetical protein WD995_10015 [Gemmatimonadota bacterium]